MALRNQHRPPGDNEVLERRQFIIHLIEFGLDSINMMIMDELETRDRDFSAQVEDSVLQTIKERGQVGERLYSGAFEVFADESKVCIQFVDVTHRAYAGVSFGNSRPVSQACLTAVSGPGVYLRQSLAHKSLEIWNQESVRDLRPERLVLTRANRCFLLMLGLLDDKDGYMNLTAQELTMV